MKAALLVIGVIGALALSACRVDVNVNVSMADNGSGAVAVTVETDAEVVARAPGLADDLRLTDVEAAGWTVEGPTVTPAGGLTVTLQHPFSTPEEATALVASLSGTDGPLRSVAFSRTVTERAVTYRVTGSGRLDGVGAFTDPDLVAAVGATPYLDDIVAAQISPDDAVGLEFSVALPGTVDAGSAAAAAVSAAVSVSVSVSAADADDRTLTWAIPADGTTVDLATTSVRSLERGGVWPALASGALIALVVWVVAAVGAVVLVARARSRRMRHRLRRFD